MSKIGLEAIAHRLNWVLKDNPNVADEELQRHRSELMITHLHPVLTTIQSDDQSEEETEEAEPQQPVEPEVELPTPQNPVPEDDFFAAVYRYEPDWLNSYVSNVIGYGIDKQGELPSGKVQVTFSTLEQHPEQEEDDDATYSYRFVCVVGYDEDKGRWIVEDHQEPVAI